MPEQTEVAEPRELSLEEISTYRASTEAVSSWLARTLEGHLDTVRPLMLPARHLGNHVKSARRSEQGAQADKLFQSLQSSFEAVSGEPLKLRGRIDSPIEAIPNKIEMWPWEHRQTVRDGDSNAVVTIQSPFSWVIAYASPLSLAQALRLLRGEGSRSEPELRQFVLRSLLLKLVFDVSPGLTALFEALRFRVDNVTCPETGSLSFLRLTADIPTFRPPDEVVLEVTKLSGVARFAELLDLGATSELTDPFLEKVVGLSSP